MSGCGARTAAGSLEAVFESSDVERFGLDFDGGLGGEAEETALFLPVMRQVFAQSQQPARGCGAFRLDFDGGLGGEAENMSLFAPVVRQVLAQSQELRRRELDRLTALKQRAHNIRRQIGQSNEGG